MKRNRNPLAVAVAVAFGALLFVPSAEAFTSPPLWQCRASASYTSVNGGNRVEPVVANGSPNTANGAQTDNAQCANAEVGGENLLTPLGIPLGTLGARTAGAKTRITPEIGKAIVQKVTSFARVEGLTLGGLTVLGVATSVATGSCTPGSLTPNLQGTSNAATLAGGNLDGLVGVLAGLLSVSPSQLSVKINEQVRTPTSLTVRAAHIKVLSPTSGRPPLADIVVAESKVGFDGPVCDPDKQGGPIDIRPCPPGSSYVPSRNLCIIFPGTDPPGSLFGACVSKYGVIIVGRPFAGPNGGIVVPIDCARRVLGNKVCLQGNNDPKFAVIGTNKRDNITGTNKADRILALGGNDSVSGGRGKDCIQGGTGNDKVSGDIAADRIFGESGRDALNGASGSDRLSGGTGNDSINAGYGSDRVTGGSGKDSITIATAGPRARVDCGSGRDKVRMNYVERRTTRNCELRYVFKDRPGVDAVRR